MSRKKDFEIEDERLLEGDPSGRIAFLEKAAEDGAIQIRCRSLAIREPEDAKDDDRRLAFVTSDETVDSYGDIIRANKWDLGHYRRNPLFLWMHNSRGLPIGRSIKETVDKTAKLLRQVFEFFGPGVGDLDGDHAKFADTVFKLYKGWKDKATRRTVRGLHATSVGFLPKPKSIKAPKDDAERAKLGLGPYGVIFEGQWLKETSGVTVPANPNALITNAYGTLLEKNVLTDDDLEVLDAFGLRREWMLDLRQQVRGKTFVAMKTETVAGTWPKDFDPDDVLDVLDPETVSDLTGESPSPENTTPESATIRVLFDGIEEHRFEVPAGQTGTLRIDRAERTIVADGDARALENRDIRRIIDQAILALTTIAETLEDDDEDGDEPRAAFPAGSISRALAQLPEILRSTRAPAEATSGEDALDVILAAE